MEKLDSEKARFLFEVMKDERDFWFGNRRALEAKAGVVVATMLTYVALVSGFVRLSDMNPGVATYSLLAGLWIALFAGLWFSLRVLLIGPASWIPFTQKVRDAFNGDDCDVPQVCDWAIKEFLKKRLALLKDRSERDADDLLRAYALLSSTIVLGIGLLVPLCDCWQWALLFVILSMILGLYVWLGTQRRIKNERRREE